MQQHLATLTALYARATDPALTHEAVEAAVHAIGDTLTARGCLDLARGFGIARRLFGKADALRRIAARISERKGRHERGEVIAALAR